MELNQQQFKIVEGVFTPSETAEVLFTLINDKIRFHNLQITEITERYNGDTSRSERRIKELQTSKEQLTKVILAARELGQTISINGTIELKMSVPTESFTLSAS
ncbi:hypothetical protein OO010_07825 [Flavobacteriaceae bacterium KMM 6898]|nr:hypothetical protein [Flavobacteriaceae bacterium KMM 6898]